MSSITNLGSDVLVVGNKVLCIKSVKVEKKEEAGRMSFREAFARAKKNAAEYAEKNFQKEVQIYAEKIENSLMEALPKKPVEEFKLEAKIELKLFYRFYKEFDTEWARIKNIACDIVGGFEKFEISEPEFIGDWDKVQFTIKEK